MSAVPIPRPLAGFAVLVALALVALLGGGSASAGPGGPSAPPQAPVGPPGAGEREGAGVGIPRAA